MNLEQSTANASFPHAGMNRRPPGRVPKVLRGAILAAFGLCLWQGDWTTADAATTVISEPPSRSSPEMAYGVGSNQFLMVTTNFDDRRREAHRLDAGGGTIGNMIVVDPSTSVDVVEGVREMSVAYGGAGNEYLVVWRDADADDNGAIDGSRLFLQRIDAATGDLLLPAPVAVSPFGERALNPSVEYNSVDDTYLVVWVNETTEAAEGVLVDATGTPSGQVYTYGAVTGDLDSRDTDIAYNPDGNGFLVAFESNAAMGVGDLLARYAGADGSPVGAQPFTPDADPADGADNLRVAYSSDNGTYLVVWEDTQSGGQSAEQIIGRRVAGNATGPIGSNIEITPGAGSPDRIEPALDYCPLRQAYLVVWENTEERTIEGRFVGDGGLLDGDILTLAGPVASEQRRDARVAFNSLETEFMVLLEVDRFASLGEDSIEAAFVPCAAARPVASVLPTSRSVQVGDRATAFGTIINVADVTATDCGIAPVGGLPAEFFYQTTDPLTNGLVGEPDTPADILPGAAQTYVFGFTPNAPIDPTDVSLFFSCSNTGTADVLTGINTLLLSASDSPVPDIIALATGDGVLELPGANGATAFAVAAANVGTGADIRVEAGTGDATLPLALSICETDPQSGVCLAAPQASVTTTVSAGATPTFGVFVQGEGEVASDPARNRIFVTFRDQGGIVRGSTSTAVETQ